MSYTLPYVVPTILEYEPEKGASPFGKWFWKLEAKAAARVTRVINRLEAGHRPDTKVVGKGVMEARIDYGPGYRVYFALDGGELILLLGGGDKRRQQQDIRDAQARWADYRARKVKGGEHGTYP